MFSKEDIPQQADSPSNIKPTFREECWEFLHWFLLNFSTREHYLRFIGTVIIVVAAYESLVVGQIEREWTVLTGMVIGYFYRGHTERKGK